MVWIYGAASRAVQAVSRGYDGENLAAKGPVSSPSTIASARWDSSRNPDCEVVGSNAPATTGMMDAIAALQWVKKNITPLAAIRTTSTVAGDPRARSWSAHSSARRRRRTLPPRDWPKRRLMGLTYGPHGRGRECAGQRREDVEALGVKTIAELRAKPLTSCRSVRRRGIVDG